MVFPSKIGFCQEYTNHGVITLSATSREQLLIQPNPFTAPQPPYYISVVTAVNKTPPLIKPPPLYLHPRQPSHYIIIRASIT